MSELTYENLMKLVQQEKLKFSVKPDNKLVIREKDYEAIKSFTGFSDAGMRAHYTTFDELKGESK